MEDRCEEATDGGRSKCKWQTGIRYNLAIAEYNVMRINCTVLIEHKNQLFEKSMPTKGCQSLHNYTDNRRIHRI